MKKKLTYGMIGGGEGAFIGSVHRKAIRLDDSAELTAGVFSRDQDNNRRTGEAHDLALERIYPSYQEMAEAEGARPDKIDFVVITTPNTVHFPVAKAFMEQGIHVVCDKPMTVTTEEAETLEKLAEKRGLLFAVTYTYAGYAAVKQARSMIARGDIGEIRFIRAEYPQDGLARSLASEKPSKQFAWRTDPAQTGAAGTLGDVGSHIEYLASYITGLRMTSLYARLDSFSLDNGLDDNGSILTEYEGGAKGLFWCSQIAWGSVNDLSICVVGSRGSISWSHTVPEVLYFAEGQAPRKPLIRGRGHFDASADEFSRIPAGHPEGVIEAFGNIYRSFTSALRKTAAGQPLSAADRDFPSVGDGGNGVRFIDACLRSSKSRSWVDL